jgi:glycosyltransferase involved in cell wall biosynthesis
MMYKHRLMTTPVNLSPRSHLQSYMEVAMSSNDMETTRQAMTVVIPVYNKRPHLERCIASLQHQTLQPDEIIFVDDGSTDGSREYLEQAIAGSAKHRLLCREPAGPGGYAARNLGIVSSNNQWIAFLDADDSWMPNHLEVLSTLIARADEQTSFVFSSFVIRDGDFSRPAPSVKDAPRKLSEEEFLTEWASGRFYPCTITVAARRTRLIDVGMFPAGLCRRGGDKDLWFRLIQDANCVGSDSVTATYHVDSTNMVTRLTPYTSGSFVAARLLTYGREGHLRKLSAKVWALETAKYTIQNIRSGNFRHIKQVLADTKSFGRHRVTAASHLLREIIGQVSHWAILSWKRKL